MALDRRCVGLPHLLLQRAAPIGNDDPLAAGVVRTGLASDQTLAFEPVEQAGEVVLREQCLLLELVGSQPPVGSAYELEQHVVPGERREAGLFEIAFDRAEHGLLRPNQAGPGQDYGIARLFVRFARHAWLLATSCRCIKLDRYMHMHLLRCNCIKRHGRPAMKLYYSPGACSLAPHIVAREAGLNWDLVKVDLATHKTEKGEDFLAINPRGYVPTLALDDGEIATEVAALVQHLAEQAPQSKLLPPTGSRERFRVQQ